MLVVQTVAFSINPYAGGTNIDFINQLPTPEVQAASCFLKPSPTLVVQTVAF